MTKIQSVKRKDNTVVYTLYIPSQIVEAAGLLKGDIVEVISEGPGILRVIRI